MSGEVRLLLRAALALFAVNVLIGLVNGQRAVTVERGLLLTHVHAGTLGWITLGVFAWSAWLLGGVRPWLAWLAAGALGCYALTFALFYPGSFLALALFGTLAALAIVAFWLWALGRARFGRPQDRAGRLGLAQLGLLAALTDIALAALLGVLIEARFLGLPFDGNPNQAHPDLGVAGGVLLAGMALAEWRLKGGDAPPRPLGGTVQVGLVLLGSLLSAGGILFRAMPVVGIGFLMNFVGALVFVARMARPIVRAPWGAPTGERLVALGALWLLAPWLLFLGAAGAYGGDFAAVPRGVGVASTHMGVVGVMTNMLFGSLAIANAGRRAWAWADHVQFWAMNVGLAGFVAGLVVDSSSLIRAFTPLMGIGILVAVGAHALRLRRAPIAAAVA